ncbi:putative protein-like [Diplonema papillatum]|nr:putative protein-like [Diplonema papillatum]
MLRGPPRYGDIDESDEVHEEIREVGRQLHGQIVEKYGQGTTEQGILEGLRQHGAAPGGQKMMNSELAAALWSIENDLYVSWRSVTGNDCCRVGPESRCFCGCPLRAHDTSSRRVACGECRCAGYQYVPCRPEEIGFGHLTRRKEFNINQWSPKCRCKHGLHEHQRRAARPKCTACSCFTYEPDWACVCCDKKGEDHSTEFETAADRAADGRSVGESYKPLAGLDPEFTDLVFGGRNAAGTRVLRAPNAHQQRVKPARPKAGQQGGALPSSSSSSSSQAVAPRIMPSSRAPASGSSRPPRSLPAQCNSCAVSFTSPTAKFCPNCGTKRT